MLIISGCSYFTPQPIQTEPTKSVTGDTSDNKISVDEMAKKDEGNKTVEDAEIIVDTVAPGDTVKSPLIVKGKALGPWFFEGTLPVQIENSKGELLDMAPARALDNWMQEGYVRFEAELKFDPGTETTGTIIIKNDNPSGLKENEKVQRIPVKFGPTKSSDQPELIGGQTDEHGCIGPAGYTWCEPKQKCLRVWEEACLEDPNFNVEEISTAFSKKYPDWNMSQMDITVNKQYGGHASGSIMEKDSEVGGGYWFAAETAKGWVIAADGNGEIRCEDIDPYDFPSDMIEECTDTNGMPVQR